MGVTSMKCCGNTWKPEKKGWRCIIFYASTQHFERVNFEVFKTITVEVAYYSPTIQSQSISGLSQ
jgi:hypothetical protein